MLERAAALRIILRAAALFYGTGWMDLGKRCWIRGVSANKKSFVLRRSFLMKVTRFELATFWSVARRSIQLSYTYATQVFYKKKRVLSIMKFRNLRGSGYSRCLKKTDCRNIIYHKDQHGKKTIFSQSFSKRIPKLWNEIIIILII